MGENKIIEFKTGKLTEPEIKLIFDTLPVDMTYVNKNDEVKYFNKLETRIFKRSTSVIGLKVQNCHPKKSIDKVQEILDDFKRKKRDVAEFWINLDNSTIHIRYFPIYDNNGNYLGCLEVSQDITDIKKIKGEKRLL
jgi:PAS domain S-box-containing protein